MSYHANNPFAIRNDAPTLADIKIIHQTRLLQKERIRNTKPVVDNRRPPDFRHLHMNRKKQQMIYEENTRIQKSNLMLVDKMRSILRPQPADSTHSHTNISHASAVPTAAQVAAAMAIPGRTLHAGARQKRNDKIMHDNHKLLQRIIGTQPVYSRVEWKRNADEKRHRSQNACRFPYFDPLSKTISTSNATLIEFGLVADVKTDESPSSTRLGNAGMLASSLGPNTGASASQKRRLQNLTNSVPLITQDSGLLSEVIPQQVATKTSDSKAWKVLAKTDPIVSSNRSPRRTTAMDAPQYIGDEAIAKSKALIAAQPINGAGPSVAHLRAMFSKRPPPRNTLFEGTTSISSRSVRIIVNEFVDPWSIEMKVLDLETQRVFSLGLPIPQLKLVYGPNWPLFQPAYRAELAGKLISCCRFVPKLSPEELAEKDAYEAQAVNNNERFSTSRKHKMNLEHNHGLKHSEGSPGEQIEQKMLQREQEYTLCIDLQPESWMAPGPGSSRAGSRSSYLRTPSPHSYDGDDRNQPIFLPPTQLPSHEDNTSKLQPKSTRKQLLAPPDSFDIYQPSSKQLEEHLLLQQQQIQQLKLKEQDQNSKKHSAGRRHQDDYDEGSVSKGKNKTVIVDDNEGSRRHHTQEDDAWENESHASSVLEGTVDGDNLDNSPVGKPKSKRASGPLQRVITGGLSGNVVTSGSIESQPVKSGHVRSRSTSQQPGGGERVGDKGSLAKSKAPRKKSAKVTSGDPDVFEMQQDQSYVLTVQICCRGLSAGATSRKCDPVVHVFARNLSGDWYFTGQHTERKQGELNPDFQQLVNIEYTPSGQTEFAFSVFDANDANGASETSDVLGSAAVSVNDLLAAKGNAVGLQLLDASGESLASDGSAIILLIARAISYD